MKILMTGFTPFGGETINPSYEAVRRMPDEVAGIQIIKMEIPTEFAACGALTGAAVRKHRPDAVICVGQAGGRAGVSVERVAINLMDARIPDNAGMQPVDIPIVPDGPAAYFSTLPVKSILRALQACGIPCSLSYTAGVYVCNCLMYSVLHLAATEFPHMCAGFLHIPYAEEQLPGKPADTPALALETTVRALICAAQTTGGAQKCRLSTDV